jgi:hypothetical protein
MHEMNHYLDWKLFHYKICKKNTRPTNVAFVEMKLLTIQKKNPREIFEVWSNISEFGPGKMSRVIQSEWTGHWEKKILKYNYGEGQELQQKVTDIEVWKSFKKLWGECMGWNIKDFKMWSRSDGFCEFGNYKVGVRVF